MAMNHIRRAIRFVTRLSAMLSGFMILTLILMNSYAVVMRYFMDSPLDWVLDVSELLMVGSVFLGAAYVMQIDGHVNVDFILGKMSKKTQGVLRTVSLITVILFTVVLVWKLAGLTWMNRYAKSSSVVMFPLFPSYFLALLGSFLLLVQCLLVLYDHLRGTS